MPLKVIFLKRGRSILISKDKILKKLSAGIEFNNFESVAVAVTMAVNDGKTNICAKMASIHVDSFGRDETKLSAKEVTPRFLMY